MFGIYVLIGLGWLVRVIPIVLLGLLTYWMLTTDLSWISLTLGFFAALILIPLSFASIISTIEDLRE